MLKLLVQKFVSKKNLTHQRCAFICNKALFHSVVAFTLAEVLVTLGIIGIIAAITIPTIVHKIRNKMLETQFKNNYAIIAQAIKRTEIELDTGDIGTYCTQYDNAYVNNTECTTAFQKAFSTGIRNSDNYKNTNNIIIRRDISIYSSPNTLASPTGTSCTVSIFRQYALANGAYIGYNIACGNFYIGIDTNGTRKPNRLGYDVFLFFIKNSTNKLEGYTPQNVTDEDLEKYKEKLEAQNSSDKEYYYSVHGYPCNYTSSQTLNGIGCSYYAIRNKCPDGSDKGYFECLK
jgi:type II secretory pathway pseudopilin PulG